MDWERLSTDQLEQQLLDNRAVRSRLDAEDIGILEVLDSRQTATWDGCRSLSEWTASRLDVGLDTASTLVRTMRRTQDRPHLREALAEGATLDRVEALTRIPDDVGLMEQVDVAGVRREAAHRARITVTDEYQTASDRFLVLQPSLDESWWKLWGGLDGVSGALVDKVITETADGLPPLPDGTRGDASWRKATALVEVCVSDNPPPAQVTVFVDTQEAAPSNGESGVVLEAGPRIGRETLEAVLCHSVTEVTARTSDGRFLEYGRTTRAIPPRLRRAVLARDGYRCTADGCDSRRRLQTHHIHPWSQGGPTDPGNLITLCWYHHQVVIHQRGFTIYRHAKHGRIRFRRPPPRGPT